MEHSLHQQLKHFYGGPHPSLEVIVDGYRIDAMSHGWLVEIQFGPLWAIRKKTLELLQRHAVLIVKPIVISRHIVRLDGDGQVVAKRRSPKEGRVWDVFSDLVHFMKVFPHPRLRIDVALVDIVEERCPRVRRRWGQLPYRLADRELAEVRETITLRSAEDLRLLLPRLPDRFDTRLLADHLGVPRWKAQQIAYCLRESGTATLIGRGRAGWQYAWSPVEDTVGDRLSLALA